MGLGAREGTLASRFLGQRIVNINPPSVQEMELDPAVGVPISTRLYVDICYSRSMINDCF